MLLPFDSEPRLGRIRLLLKGMLVKDGAFSVVSLATGYIYATEVLAVVGLRRFFQPWWEKRYLADPAILSCVDAIQVRSWHRGEVQTARRRGHNTQPPVQSAIPRPRRRS